MKKDVDELISELLDDDVGIRRISAQTIENIAREDPLKVKDIIPEILKTLNSDDDSYIRATIAKILGDIGLKEPDLVKIAIPELIIGLNDKYVEVQENARYALETIGSQSPYLPHLAVDTFYRFLRQYADEEEGITDFQLLVKCMENENKWTRYFTIGAIVDYLQQNDEGLNEAKKLLKKALESNDFWMKKGGLWAFCQLWSKDILKEDTLPIIKSGLNETSPEVRRSAINCINIILQKQNERVDELAPLILERFKDEEKRIRELAYAFVIDIYESYPHMEKDIISKLTKLKRKTKQKETRHLIARTLEHIAKPKIKEQLLKKGRYLLSKIAKKYNVSASFVKNVVQQLSREGINVEVVNEEELLDDFLSSLNSDEEKIIRNFLKQLSREQEHQIDLNELMTNVFSEEQLKRVINKMLASHWIKGEIQEEKKFIRKNVFFVGSVTKPRDLIIVKK
ncbi:MAG: HEAT repeat domain-containing protein [Promethearchaeota archaeon]